jgi:hypothetical protein
MSENTIGGEAQIAALTDNAAFDLYDADNTQRTKKGLLSQFAAYLRNKIAFGGGAAVIGASGNINVQVSSAGITPGATAADNVLAAYTLPASSFDQAGRGVAIQAQGSFAATANNKRIKIIVNPASAAVGSTVGAGGTTVADTGTVATNGGGWSLQADLLKYGAAASNTQIGLHQQAQIGGAVAALLAPSLITATESGAILIAVTGNATTAATDIVFNALQVQALN